MPRAAFLSVFGAMVAALALLSPAVSSAGHLDQSQLVDDMVMHLGVVPAQRVAEHPDWCGCLEHESAEAAGLNAYHVMIALFDRTSGERITDATVEAQVSTGGHVGRKKSLGVMDTGGGTTYCNFFTLSVKGTNAIDVYVRRSETAEVVKTRFEYTPYRG